VNSIPEQQEQETRLQIPGAGLEIAAAEGGKKLTATYTPTADGGPVDIDWLRRRLDELGFADWFVPDNGLAELLRKYNAGGEPFTLDIGEARDGQASVEISSDRMEAFLSLTPPHGGEAVGRRGVNQLLEEKGVVFGLLGDEIEQALASGEVKRRLIASGQPPVHGEDGKLVSLVREAERHIPRADEHGRVDYRELGGIITVKQGDRLMQRIAATQGLAGQNVLGQPIPAKPGKEVAFASGLAGVQIDPEDADYLVAATSGQPVPVQNGMTVEPAITIDNVDLSVGNLDFEGSVNIKGDVKTDMVVRVTGDINVGGTVEAATLDAGGNILIKGGVIGHAEGHEHGPGDKLEEARIHCDGSLSAKFLENAVVEAGDSILVEDLAMQCTLEASNSIVVGKAPGKGRIIGGVVQAGKEVQAAVIGSPANVKTRIAVGVNPQLNDRRRHVLREVERHAKEMEDIEKILRFAAQNPGRMKEETLERVHRTREALEHDTGVLQQELEEITAQLSLIEDAKVVVTKNLFSNVTVSFGEKYYQSNDERGPGAFLLREGEIVFE
jgi:uncharacterized protein (DUF342 family)